MDKWCAAFPGREAVKKGLERSFYNNSKVVRDLFSQASDFCHKDIAKLCYDSSSIDNVWQTVCLVTHCYALYNIVVPAFGLPFCTTGYSQGEFTACIAAGVFQFPEILKLIYELERVLLKRQVQKECMYRIVDINVNCLEEICHTVDPTGKHVCISAYLSNTQNIISGKQDFAEAVIGRAKERGARWAISLHTNTAYHCHLCDEPARASKPLFQNQYVKAAKFPVYGCYDGKRSFAGKRIRYKLSKQLNHPIQWKTLVENMASHGITNLIELGPGCTVSANTRIAVPQMSCKWIGSMKDL